MSSNVQNFLNRKPIFTLVEFNAMLDERNSRNGRTKEALLAHYVRTGRIYRIRRGLYVSLGLGARSEKAPIDPYLIAGKLTADSVLAYHTALEFHGRAYSAHERLLYLTEHVSRPLTFQGRDFKSIRPPNALEKKHRLDFGVLDAERAGVAIRVTSLERTLVDVLDRRDLGGSWEEIWRSLESVEYLNLDRVIEYARLLNNATTISKVGFFLEQHRESLMVEEKHLAPLRVYRPRSPHYMSRGKRQNGRLNENWNLIVPLEVIERSWQEVS